MRRLAFILCLGLFSLAPYTFAQTGFPAFGSFQSTGFDVVNRQNLNVIFAIPILSIPARGQNFQYNLVNNSLLWNETTVGSSTTWTPVTDANGNPTWGWYYGPASSSGQILSQISSHTCRYLDPDTGLWVFAPYAVHSGFKYKDWLGTIHPFSVTYIVASADAANCGIYTTTGSGYSTDNTGFYLYASQSSTYVLSPAGVAGGGAAVDTNGNYVSQTVVNSTETDWTDTAGHPALKVFKNASNIQYEWQDSSGNYTSVTTTTVQLSTLNIKTNFACSGVGEYAGTASLPTEVDLPDGQKYLLTYEPTPGTSGYYTGRVKRVTFPTGGYYEYDYPTTPGDGIVCTDGTVDSLTRLMSDGTNTAAWTFSRALSGPNWVTTVAAPQMPYDSAANTSVYTFNSSGQQITAQIYQGGVTLQRTINTTWTNGAPATQITILEDGQTQNEVETSYDTYGNVLTLKEHDWGTNTPGPILRTVTRTYLNSSPYISANILNRPTTITLADSAGTVHSRTDIAYDESGYINYVCRTGVPQHNDTSGGCSVTVRGNPTTLTTYTNAAAATGAVTHHFYYDNLGNLVKADLDCCQSKTWSYSAATNYSFPDSATRGSSPGTQLTTSATYNSYTGLTASSTDENGQVTYYGYDNMKRRTSVQLPDANHTTLTWTYADAVPPAQSSVTASVPIQGSAVQQTITTVNGLGRPVTQQISDGTTTYSIAQTQYDTLGRPYMTSNPYTSTAQYWTTSQFDALGRPTKTILPDNSQTTFSYSSNTTTVTDPASKARKSVVDGLGRMTSVYEPDPSSGNALTLQTSYTYNILDIPTGVTQGSQTRTYVYDDLGRATSVQTPETNQLAYQYQYNNFGLATQRTDPRGVITTYSYDNLNRLTGISYNVTGTGVTATPGVSFSYDAGGAAAFALGRLTSMTEGAGSETYAYNNLGEMTQLQKVINGTTYTLGYGYNLAGELSSITYPSGRNVQQNFDNIGRLSSIADTSSGLNTTRASGFAYNAAFQVTGFNYGNGVAAAFGYTPDRLLLQSLAYTKGSTTLFSANYWYKTDSTNCPAGASGNNGQIQCIADNVDSGRTVAYSYDALYRLTSAVTNGSANYPKWGLSFAYDRYGNRTAQTVTAGSGVPSNSVSVDATTNRINGSGYAYDANGNTTNDGNNTLAYDAENRLVSATNGGASGTYSYDGNGLRVKKVSGSTTTVYIFSGSRVIAEYDNGVPPAAPSREYIFGGALIARIGSVDVRFTNDSCSACGGNPVGGGDRNLFINSITVGSTTVQPNDASVSYVTPPCNSSSGGVGSLYCNGDMITTAPAAGSAQSITVSAYGSPDYNIYPHMQLLVGGILVGEWDVTGTAQNYTVNLQATATQYYSGDQLSNRLVTDSSGNPSAQLGHYPFGETWYNATNDKLLFTSYERDAESGNDYALFRYHVNRLGRFSSPDPLAGSTSDPQSLNRYAYTLNDPGNFVDPLGLCGGGGQTPDLPCPDVTSVTVTGGEGRSAPFGSGGFFIEPPITATAQIFARTVDGPTGGGTGATPPQSPGQTKTCDVSARVLQGNPATVGLQGGIPGAKVQAGSAAVVPSEFGVGSGAGLAPYALQISGYFPGTGVSFQGATDVIGGPPPMGFNNIRDYLEFINPGQVIIELPTGPDLGRVPAIINVPAGAPCPTAPPVIGDAVTGPTVG